MSKSKNDTFTPFHPQILLGTLIASGSFLCVEEDGNRLLDVFVICAETLQMQLFLLVLVVFFQDWILKIFIHSH